MKNKQARYGLVVFLVATVWTLGCRGNRYVIEEPITVDFDMEEIPEPREWNTSQFYDLLDRTFSQQMHQALDMPRNFRKLAGRAKEAENVDRFGRVPDSSWFTNRNGRRRMSLEAIRRGPNQGSGPADGVWTVVRGKSEGVTLGFTIKDSRGDRYIIKFDTPDYPEMSTAAEVITTKLFYAMGYNTPQNRIVRFGRDRLRVGPKATVASIIGGKRRMTEKDLKFILDSVYNEPDGTIRAVASRFLSGVPKGPFAYLGTRKDDPNDIIPHEHRRDLRGLRILGAWVEHNDIRRINSLDMYVEEEGRHFLRHYLLDFGATLGSASLFPNQRWEGHEYILDSAETAKSLFTLGLYKRRWHDAKPVVYPTVGYFESELFNPANWKPNYPNPAFENMTRLDAYWAARIVMSFDDAQIRVAVETGELSDPAAAEYLIQTLIERRDKIGRYVYGRVNALDNITIREAQGTNTLFFDDLMAEAGFSDPATIQYRYRFAPQRVRRTYARHARSTRNRSGTPGATPHQVVRPAAPVIEGSVEIARGIPVDEKMVAAAQDHLQMNGPGDERNRFFYLTLWARRDARVEDWGRWVRVHLYFVDAKRGFNVVSVEHER